MITLDDQVAEIERELFFRGRVYPGLVARGKMTQKEADRHTARMRAALDTIKGLAAKERLL